MHVKRALNTITSSSVDADTLQIVRYGIAGVAVSIGYTINVFALVDLLKLMGPTAASSLSFVLWTPISYVVHRDFTFRSAVNSRKVAVKFATTFLAKMAMSALVVYLFSVVFNLHYIFGVLSNWIALPILNYIVLDGWVFKDPIVKDESQAPGHIDTAMNI